MQGDVDGDVVRSIRIHNELHLLSITILYWDHCLTFSDEVHLLWRSPPHRTARARRSTIYFFLNRYLADVGDLLITVVQFAEGVPGKWCSHINLFRQLLLIINQCIVCILFTLRIYALYALDRRVYIGMFGLGAALLGLSCWALIGRNGGRPQLDVPGCHIAFDSERAGVYLAVPWEALFLYDIVIFAALMLNVVKRVREDSDRSARRTRRVQVQRKRHSVLRLLVRDGAIYFVIMAMVNLANIVTFYISPPLLRGCLSTLATSMSVTLTSRLMLNLHAVGRTGVFSANTRQEEDASDRLGGESELELDTLYTEDLERSMAVGTGSAQQTRRPAR